MRITISSLMNQEQQVTNQEPQANNNGIRIPVRTALFDSHVTPELVRTLPWNVTEAVFESAVSAEVLRALPENVTSVKFNALMRDLATLQPLPETVTKFDFSGLTSAASLTFLLERAMDYNGFRMPVGPLDETQSVNRSPSEGGRGFRLSYNSAFFPVHAAAYANSSATKRGYNSVDEDSDSPYEDAANSLLTLKQKRL